MRVRPVESSRDRKRFVEVLYEHYREDEAFVAPLRQEQAKLIDPEKNAFFEHGAMQLFLAEDVQGRILGRIAAIENGEHLRVHQDGVGFFGFFESVDDEAVAGALLQAAERWLRERGLQAMRGPANPSMNDVAGLLVDGFDREPSLMMPYNKAYYPALLADFGLERVMTMWAYYCHKKYVRTEKLRRGTELVMRRTPGLSIRTLRKDRLMEEARHLLRIYNDAWEDNWGHVALTEAELEQLVGDLKQIVDERIVFFLEQDGEPVAFSLSLPNLNLALRHVNDGRLLPTGLAKILAYSRFGGVYECRMLLMGVVKRLQGRGLYAPLVLETIVEGPKAGYDACEMSWVLDANMVLINALEEMGGVVDKEYAMYEKPVEAAPHVAA